MDAIAKLIHQEIKDHAEVSTTILTQLADNSPNKINDHFSENFSAALNTVRLPEQLTYMCISSSQLATQMLL
ncbi:hypothetical protein FGO68_gene3169 [Halteria grandinella]|uniref:Uncharacterized protein n=1 Tax=Halteria grandinella TaxID=5974 RepID=A0A8J8T099_HALGN|nr:hypothetical protein FGO68_gene3169 [Halteria grandinella]